jgi:hypothetical protein
MDVRIPANAGVIRYLERIRGSDPRRADVRPPGDLKHDYWGLGAHPEIVERIWDEIGRNLPPDCRQVVVGTPALVHPGSGTLLAVAIGTSYAIRLPAAVRHGGLPPGVQAEILWSDRTRLNVQQEFGGDWAVGAWSPDEERWSAAMYAELESR